MDYFEIIKQHGLTIRKTPEYSEAHWRVFADTQEEATKKHGSHKDLVSLTHRGDRLYIKHLKWKGTANGKWFVKSTPKTTSTNTIFSLKKDCVADTLEEAVDLWLQRNADVPS